MSNEDLAPITSENSWSQQYDEPPVQSGNTGKVDKSFIQKK